MQHAYNKNDVGPVTEMAIVNTFTKLIFGDGSYTFRELLIIQALREVDDSVLRDSHQEMGEYLRNLGVREMIQLVSHLQQHIKDSVEIPASNRRQAAPTESIGPPGHTRDVR